MSESESKFSKIKNFIKANKTTTILITIVLAIILIAGNFLYQQIFSSQKQYEEIDLAFDPEGPYALTFPRRDGNALILNIKRTSSYNSISYELAYTSRVDETSVQGSKILDEGESGNLGRSGSIDRGVVGTIDTKEKKGEYEQEILFGTCSKNVCKYDQGVENGTLTLKITKEKKIFRMVTQWHLQKPDVALGVLSSGDGHLIYKVDADREVLANVGFSIINDLTGVPKLPVGKEVLGKVYALNVPIAKELQGGQVSLELAENPPSDAKLYRHDGSNWQELDTKVDGNKLTATSDGAGIFAVFIPQK